MDRERFDACTRLFAATRSRRAAVATLLGFAFLGHDYIASDAKPGTNTGRGKGKRRVNGGKKRKSNRLRRERGAQAEAVAANCFTGSPCLPGKGANLAKCNFGGTNALENKNVSGANLGKVNLAGANASGAKFAGANLGGACLVDANLTGAQINGSTNLGRVIFCRTTMPDGSTNDSGCGKGTRCCPTCDEDHACGDGEVCCNGRCRPGDCCLASDCREEPCQIPACVNNQCQLDPAANGAPCPNDAGICCGGTCRVHQCSSNQDCPAAAPVCAGGTCLIQSGCTGDLDRCSTGEAVLCPDNPNGLCIRANGGQFCLSNGGCIDPGFSCCDCVDPFVCVTIDGPECCFGAGSQFCLPRATTP